MNSDWEKSYSRAKKQIEDSRPVSTPESKLYEERHKLGVCIRCGKKKEPSLPYCAECIQQLHEALKDEDIIGVCPRCAQTFSWGPGKELLANGNPPIRCPVHGGIIRFPWPPDPLLKRDDK